jgi:hypothetical protein
MRRLAYCSVFLGLGLCVAAMGCNSRFDLQPGANLPALDEPDAGADGQVVAPPKDTSMPYPPLPTTAGGPSGNQLDVPEKKTVD